MCHEVTDQTYAAEICQRCMFDKKRKFYTTGNQTA